MWLGPSVWSQASRCGQELPTRAQFSAESLVRAPGMEHLGRNWVGKHHRPGLVPVQDFLSIFFSYYGLFLDAGIFLFLK